MPYALPGGVALDPAEAQEPDEEASIEAILAVMRGMSRERWGTVGQRRGAHAKGHALLWGTFEVLDVPPALRHGLFARPGTYEVCIRLSSYPQSVGSDASPNVRGIALKVLGVPGQKLAADGPRGDAQDFLLITADRVGFGTIADFRSFIVSQADGRELSWFAGKEGRERLGVTAATASTHTQLLGLTWSSTTPYRLGDAVVKYRVTPGQPAVEARVSADHLARATVQQLAEGPFTLDFAVQVQTDPATQPVEDASVEWSVADAPPVPVARIHLPTQAVDAPGRAAYVEGLRFDPWHSLPEHRPLGGLNRVRGVVYGVMAAERLASAGIAPYEADRARSELSDTALPQHERAPEARARLLVEARQQYVPDPAKLPTLTMCKGVPAPSTPTIEWVATAGGLAAKILGNSAACREARHAPAVGPVAKLREGVASLLPGKAKVEALGVAAMDRVLSTPLPTRDRADDLALRSDIDGKLRVVLSGAMGPAMGAFEEDKAAYLYRAPAPLPRATSLGEYEALHRVIPPCPAAQAFHDDATFARRRIVGPNPTFLQRVDRLPDHFRVPPSLPGLAAALAEGRAFLADYAALDTLLEPAVSKRGVPMYCYAPLALFAAPPGGGALAPVAVQCGQDPSRFPIVRPGQGWDWAVARTVVEVADMCWFEPVTHLALTHLVMEATALATHRCLAPNHPVHRLLLPHLEGTISVNDQAVNHLLADAGAIDQTFAATMSSIRAAASLAVRTHDFRGDTLPARLAARGLDDRAVLPDNGYRDDALRVWGAVGDWVRAYVLRAYPTEADILADTELRAWVAALSADPGAGGLNGFGVVRCRADLVEVLHKLVYTGSAGHAAVNFPQWSDAAFSPRMSGAGYAPVPPTGATEAQWLAMLPPIEKAELHAEFLYLLGALYHTRLGQYESTTPGAPPAFRDPVVTGELLPAFQRRLVEIEAAIAADNQSRRAVPYEHLLPSRIPQSINI